MSIVRERRELRETQRLWEESNHDCWVVTLTNPSSLLCYRIWSLNHHCSFSKKSSLSCSWAWHAIDTVWRAHYVLEILSPVQARSQLSVTVASKATHHPTITAFWKFGCLLLLRTSTVTGQKFYLLALRPHCWKSIWVKNTSFLQTHNHGHLFIHARYPRRSCQRLQGKGVETWSQIPWRLHC